MHVELTVNVVKHLSRTHAITSRKHSFAVERIAIDVLYILRPNKERKVTVIDTILSISRTRRYMCEIFNTIDTPILRDHPHLGALVTGRHVVLAGLRRDLGQVLDGGFFHIHANPMFSRCWFTLACSASTLACRAGRVAA